MALLLGLLISALAAPALRADSYDDTYIESFYITQCSATGANPTMHLGSGKAAYGFFNDWRIGNGKVDFAQPGEAAIGAIGLLYGYNRLAVAGRSNAVFLGASVQSGEAKVLAVETGGRTAVGGDGSGASPASRAGRRPDCGGRGIPHCSGCRSALLRLPSYGNRGDHRISRALPGPARSPHCGS